MHKIKRRNRHIQRSKSACAATPCKLRRLIPPTPHKLRRRKSLLGARSISAISPFYQQMHNIHSNIKSNKTNLKLSQVQFINKGLIGKGSFSCVYMVKKTTTNKVYALKQSIHPAKINRSQQNNNLNFSDLTNITNIIPCLSEVAILTKLQNNGNNNSSFFHTNICKYRLFFFSNDRLHQIYELYPFGTLNQLIETQKNKLNSLQILQILIQIINGICYIHFKNIIHCDIKPENIFVELHSENVIILKLGDFGISVDMNNSSNYINQNKLKLPSGDPVYISPEVLKQMNSIHNNHENLKKIDVYSLGIIIIELIFDVRLPSQGHIFTYLRNIQINNKINWDLFMDKMSVSNNNNQIMSIIRNELLLSMLYQKPKNRICSKNLALRINKFFNNQIKQQSLIEFSQLTLPTKCNNSNEYNKQQQIPMFCCDKIKINHIPITFLPQINAIKIDNENTEKTSEEAELIIHQLNFESL